MMTVDASQWAALNGRLETLARSAKREMAYAVEDIAELFLDTVQSVLVTGGHMVTGELFASFMRGGPGAVWERSHDGLTLTVGSGLEFARYVNDGHTQPGAGAAARFLPGYWSGGKFHYDPSAQGGVMLRAKWVPGIFFMESAQAFVEREMSPYLRAFEARAAKLV